VPYRWELRFGFGGVGHGKKVTSEIAEAYKKSGKSEKNPADNAERY
jgi:hypothetical protein